MGSAISGTPRSGPQAVQDARSARLEEPVLDGRGPGRTGRSGEVHEARDVAEDVAENVSLRGLRGRRRLPARSPMQKKFGAKDREASFLGRFRRFSAALARGRPGRGARAPQRSEERRGPRPGVRGRSASASDAASAGPTLPLKYGLARLSPATTPGRGAQLASTRGACGGARARADPRSECGAGSFRQALQRPRGARTARPRLCRPNSVRPQGSPQRAISEAEAMPRRRAGPARSGAERFMSAGASPMAPIGLRGATRRVPEGGPRRGPWHAPCGAPVPFLAPRAGAAVGASVPRRPQAPCGARLRAGSSWIRTTRSRRARGAGARPGRRRRGRARNGAAFGSGRRGGRADAPHGSRRRGPPPLAVTPRESPARRVPAAEGGLRATPHRGRSQAKHAAWPDAVPLCPSPRSGEGAPAPPSGAASGPAAEQVAAAPKAS